MGQEALKKLFAKGVCDLKIKFTFPYESFLVILIHCPNPLILSNLTKKIMQLDFKKKINLTENFEFQMSSKP